MYDITTINFTKTSEKAFTNTFIVNGEWDLESIVFN